MNDVLRAIEHLGKCLRDGKETWMGLPAENVCIAAAAEITMLRTLLKDCADELEDQVEGHYAQTKDHPAMKRRYDRDMAPVIAARAALPQ